jgi:hypothetical protein
MKPHHHKIIELKQAGLTLEQIAHRVYRSPGAVKNVITTAYKSNILVKQTVNPLRDEIIRRVEAGERQIDVAAALGVSKGKVAGIMSRRREALSGKPKKPPPPPRQIVQEIAPPIREIAHMQYLWELGHGQCKYPASKDEDGVHLFCAAPVRDEKCSYCRSHAAICYEPLRRSPRKKRIFSFARLRHATHDSEI